jgi:hypothetical protein
MNEMTPGMNTQATKPPVGQQGGAIPMQPTAPPPEPKSIREYLNTLKAGQVPTFTNIPGQTGQFAAPNAMVFKDIGNSPGGPITPYGPGEAGPGAIPEQGAGDPADKPITGNDPYAMAKERLPHMLPQLKEEFSAKYGNKLSLEEYDKVWGQAVTHLNNKLIQKYEKKLEKLETEGLKLIKDYTGESVEKWKKSQRLEDLVVKTDWNEIYQKALINFDKLGEYDARRETMTADEFAEKQVKSIQDAMQRRLESEVQKDRDRRGAGGQNGANMVPPELQEKYKAATADYQKMKSAKHGITGQPLSDQQILETIGTMYPELKPYF